MESARAFLNSLRNLSSRVSIHHHAFQCHNLQITRYLHQTGSLNVVPKNLKGKSQSSQQWLARHLNDPYVARARKLGYRARSAFKLTELDESFGLLKPGQILLDCGAAPGAWTQVAVQRINSDGRKNNNPRGKIVAVDLLPIEPIDGAVTLPEHDFTQERTRQIILRLISDNPDTVKFDEPASSEVDANPVFDGILSDMAPNASGDAETDHYRIINLVNIVKDFALQNAKPGSFLVAKIWNGCETKKLVKSLEKIYKFVKTTKPNASRDSSAEMFIVAKNKFRRTDHNTISS